MPRKANPTLLRVKRLLARLTVATLETIAGTAALSFLVSAFRWMGYGTLTLQDAIASSWRFLWSPNTLPTIEITPGYTIIAASVVLATVRLLHKIRKDGGSTRFFKSGPFLYKLHERSGAVERYPYCPLHKIQYVQCEENYGLTDDEYQFFKCPICEFADPRVTKANLDAKHEGAKSIADGLMTGAFDEATRNTAQTPP